MPLISVPTQVANLALFHCGVTKGIQDLYTDNSLEAQACHTWFDTARRTALKKIPWSFATKQVIPGLVANFPTNEWLYAYAYPSDALKLTRFMSWRLNDDVRESRVPYRVMQPVAISLSAAPILPAVPYPNANGLWIYTNWPGSNVSLPVVLEYTFDNVNVDQWPDDFIEAFSLSLADKIVTSLTSGNPQQQREQIRQLFLDVIDRAAADNLNEEQRPPEPQATAIRGRDGAVFNGLPGMSWVATPGEFVIQ